MKNAHALFTQIGYFILFFLSGCSLVSVQTPLPTPEPTPAVLTTQQTNETYTTIPLYYATDRSLNSNEKPAKKYGTDRGTLTYGTCQVSIPKKHKLGEVERPSIWKLEFSEDPSKHITLRELAVMDPEAYYADIKARVQSAAGKNAFVFIHGFNVTFEDAALRTAQMAFDLEFAGAPVFYSWPSKGSAFAYTVDEATAEWAYPDLKTFLADFADKSSAESIYLIAHSMGNRVLTRALVSLMAERPELKSRFREIILAAPDIDADVFKKDLAPKMVNANLSLTLYASSHDKALVASQKVHGYPRAGESGDRLVLLSGMETIDATKVDSDDWLLGHSYYGSRSILSDMFYLIQNGQRAKQRFSLKPITTPNGEYYELQ